MASRRNLIIAAMLLGMIALVAVASRGHSPAGNGTTHGIDPKLLWEFVVFGVLALCVVCAPVALWVFLSTQFETASLRRRRRRRAKQVLVLLAILLIVGLGAVLRADQARHGKPPLTSVQSGAARPYPPGHPAKPVPFDWLPAIVMLSVGVVGAALVAYLMFRRAAKRPRTQAELAAQLSAVLDDSLDDLRAESDPRRAVIAAYARMEVTLAGAGLPRVPAETPFEYLSRVLRELLHTSAEAVARLTALFERAKFSTHEIDVGMKNDAIDALVMMRDELRAAT